MKLDQLVAGLSARKGAIITLLQGKPARHSYAGLAGDVARARENLIRWKVKPGMRVGIFAPNSYAYIVYDLALVDLKAISVPFPDDFAGSIDHDLVDRYNISLLLLARNAAHSFGGQDNYIAVIDGDNGDVCARPDA